MKSPLRSLALVALVVGAIVVRCPADSAGPSDPPETGLRLVAKIPMPQMSGTWDHLTADGATGRLFLSAQEDHAVDVVDLRTNRPIRRIKGFFHRPQGEFYVPGLNLLAVTNGRDGTCKVLNGLTCELKYSVQLSMGADMIEYDPATRLLYVESGGKDSKRGPGSLTLIRAETGTVAGKIVTDFRAAAMAMERDGSKLFVALPGADQIAVIDRNSRRITARFPVGGRPASLALDEARHRLFVATRTFAGEVGPPRWFAFDADSGRRIAALDSTDGTESMYYDAAHRRIYSTSLEGPIMVYGQSGADDYSVVAKIPAPPHSGTSQLVPEMNRFCVAIPPEAGRAAEVWVFATSASD